MNRPQSARDALHPRAGVSTPDPSPRALTRQAEAIVDDISGAILIFAFFFFLFTI